MNHIASNAQNEWSYLTYNTTRERTRYGNSINVSTNTGVAHSGRLFFRFSFLVFDLAALNIVNFILLYLLNAVSVTPDYLILFFATNISWTLSAYFTALYFAREGFLKRTVQAFLVHAAVILLFIFIYNFDYSRLFVILSFTGYAVSLTATRTAVIGTQHFFRSKASRKKVIILGYNELSQQLAHNLSKQVKKFEVLGFFDDQERKGYTGRNTVLGSINDSIWYALENDVTEIYSTIPPETNSVIYEIAQQAEMNMIRFKFVPDFRIFINRRVHIGFEHDIPVLSLHSEPLQNIEARFKKRVFDILFSSFVIVFILSWLVPIIALLIKLDSKGPVFFKQLRSGKNNRPFYCFKFRSLKVNNEADSKQVTRNDNRFTRLGKFLRKSNLDELPQFYNVLQGNMSIVGPRPHMLKHTQEYSNLMNRYMVRHFVKPGVTGWAQINGYRGEIKKVEQLQKRVEYDINYMENWSMWFDLKIILLTVYTTIRGDKNAF